MKQDILTIAMCNNCQKMTEQFLLTIFFDLRAEYQNWQLECTICKHNNKIRLDNTDDTPIENYDVLHQLEMIPTSSTFKT